MTQNERLDFLLRCLLAERGEYADIRVPDSISEKRRLLRSLMNVRPPVPASEDFLARAGRLSDGAPCKARRHKADRPDAGASRPVSLAGRHYYAGGRRHRQRGQQPDAGAALCLVMAVSTMPSTPMRACSSGWNAPAIMQRQGREEATGRCKNYKSLQSALPLCAAYRRPYHLWQLSPEQTGSCWPAATAPAWSWLRKTACKA